MPKDPTNIDADLPDEETPIPEDREGKFSWEDGDVEFEE